jgi:hypothetical protein
MARTASMTPSEALDAAQRALGYNRPNGAANINATNRGAVRAWLVAEGIPSAYVQTFSLETLRGVWGDASNGTLSAMRQMARNVPRDAQAETADEAAELPLDSQVQPPQTDRPLRGTPTDAAKASKMLADALAAISALNGQPAAKLDEDRVRAIALEVVAQSASVPLVIEVRRDGDLVGRIEGRHHPKFTTLLKAAGARDASGHVPNIWITGPAGSGKTRAVSDCCKTLGIGFEHNGALSMPHELVGFVDAGGKFHETAFTRAYDAACGYLFDEVDGSDNAALLALNAALANGHASLPKGTIARHADNRIFVAANTWGHGATAEYVGRAKIDAAFLDRFPVKIHFDYDEALERDICGNPDWAIQVQAARAKAKAVGLKIAITPRASIGGAALIAAGFTKEEAASMTYLATLTAEQRKQITA